MMHSYIVYCLLIELLRTVIVKFFEKEDRRI
jgi:hypothetical protein